MQAGPGLIKNKAGSIGSQDNDAKKEGIAEVGAGIEKEAGSQQPDVSDSARQQKIDHVYDWKKQQVCKRVKNHTGT